MYSRTCIEQKENVKERLIMRLLEPIKVGKIELKNRVMFPPMTTGYEGRDGTIVEQSFNFYKRLAEGGVSYIVLGDVAPVNTISPTPKLFHDGQIEAFRKLADAVHEFDCKLGIQIFHPEYDVEALAELFRKGDMEGGRAKMRHDMVHFIQEVTEEQLNSILDKIGECVKRAQSAGVDIIEVHGDRLIGSFCSTLINRRTDSYGGSFENRIRFALRVVDKIREVAPDICIDYKLPVVTENPLRGKGGLMINEAVEFAKNSGEIRSGYDSCRTGKPYRKYERYDSCDGNTAILFHVKIYKTDQRSSLYSGILSGTYRHTGERRSTDRKWCLRHRGSGTFSSGRSGLCKETRSRRRKTHPSLYDVQ